MMIFVDKMESIKFEILEGNITLSVKRAEDENGSFF